MPAKSRHKKGKFSPQRKQRTNISPAPRPPAMTAPQPVAPKQPANKARSTPPPAAEPMALPLSYSTVSKELKTIGIIGGILLVVLIVIGILL
jgi:hypothetical protein